MIFLEYPNVLSVRGQKNGWMSIRFSMKIVILWRIIRRLRSERTGMDGAGSSLMNVAQGAVALTCGSSFYISNTKRRASKSPAFVV